VSSLVDYQRLRLEALLLLLLWEKKAVSSSTILFIILLNATRFYPMLIE
jgi:hypothetical protein